MKAVVIRQHGEIDELTFESNWPDPQARKESVVVAVRACSLNYHDLFTLRGMPGIKVPMPIIMGIDVAGEIVDVGPGVSGWKVGDRVLVDPLLDGNLKGLLGEMVDGGLAQYCEVGAYMLIPLPDSLSYAAAAALPTAYGTAFRMVNSRGRVMRNEKVLILGASGGVGSCCVQLAKLAGAQVIVAASSEAKLERLYAIGASEGINYAQQDFMKVIHERFGKPRVWTGEGGVDMVVNFTGGDTWVPALRCLRKGGRLLTCGATAGYAPQTDIRYIWTYELNILGANGWTRDGLHALLELAARKLLIPTVDSVLPLSRTAQAFALLDSRRVFGKIVIDPWA